MNDGIFETRHYSLEKIKRCEGIRILEKPGEHYSYFDKSTGKWRIRIKLDDDGLWYLSVFVRENGEFEKYSLDEETADDSHYEFSEEYSIRKKIAKAEEEKLPFEEICIRYVMENGGKALLKAIYPYVTAQFHY